MLLPKNAIVVSELAGNKAVLKIDGNFPAGDSMLALGFKWDEKTLVRPIAGHEDRQNLIRELIARRALFVGGPDWSPSELVEYYRDQGCIKGTYLRIVWKDPDHYQITDS